MKRILFVCTGEKYPHGAFNFLRQLVEEEPACLTGLFFCPLDYELIASASYVPIADPYLKVREHERDIVSRNKTLFAICSRAALHVVYTGDECETLFTHWAIQI